MTRTRIGRTRQPSPPGRRRPTTSELGILAFGSTSHTVERFRAAPDLSGLVERHWLVRWSLPPGERSSITLLPHPCVNLAFDRGSLTVNGVGTARFTYEYAGTGQVFGVKFRPGAFFPFLRRPVSELTGQVRPLSWLWGDDAAGQMAADLAAAGSPDDMVASAEDHLRRHWPEPDPAVALIEDVVHTLLCDRSIQRVDEAAHRFGLSPRSLQRLFQRYVGVSPRTVLRHYRLHEAAALLARDTGRPWAEVAADLGYHDQSHFIRDFRRAVGMTPSAYAAKCRDEFTAMSQDGDTPVVTGA